MNQSAPPSRELTHIGHYAILDSIGRGGMGLVYLARDTRLDRLVAIKCLRSELFEPLYRERFKREALLLAKLNHPYIVQIYDFIETPEQLGLVMEFVEGQNLQRYLREQIAPFSQRMQWLTQIAQGLAVAHDAGIIHRDLKAENILINKRGEAKISDLGIAKSLDSNLTLTEHVTGSYASMSPEQALGNPLDFRSDLFSFGILAYQLLCGAHPFGDTDNKMQLLQRIISQPPTSPSKHNPDLPAEISDLLGQLLSKDPTKRPANTHWLAAQCEKLSQLVLTSSFESDNTPVLLHSGDSLKSYTTGNHTGGSLSGIRKHYTGSTREHATFDTRAGNLSLLQRICGYVKHHKTHIGASCAILLIIAGITAWQLQPKPPRYIAVLPPALTTTKMQTSQQELVKAAVYDAIQQSILQLDGYYLIPRNEIEDINAANTKEGIESVQRATAADELISTDIKCEIEACTITLSRITPDGKMQNSRLRVTDTKTIDVLTDNYLSVAATTQNNIGRIYSKNIDNSLDTIAENDYATFLRTGNAFRDKGATSDLLNTLDNLNKNTKNLTAFQTLYSEIALDLHHENQNPIFLEKLEQLIETATSLKNNIAYQFNAFYLQVAEEKYIDAKNTIDTIKKLNPNDSITNELYAYLMMAKKDYTKAKEYYSKAIKTKRTANNLYYLALCNIREGHSSEAKSIVKESLELSPNFYKSQRLLGTISLVEGDLKSAIDSFEKIIAEKPNDIKILENLGLSYLLDKNYNSAITILERARTLAPEDTAILLNQADAQNLMGKVKESKDIYKEIINLIKIPKNPEELRRVSQAYAHLNNFSAALDALQKVEKIDPESRDTTYTAALIHTMANNKTSAIFNIENSLKNGANHIWFGLAWFDSLCQDPNFEEIMKKYGEPDRCSPQSKS